MAERLLFFVRVETPDGMVGTRYLPLDAVRRARDPLSRVVGKQVDRLADDLHRIGVWTNRSRRRRLVWTTGIERGEWRG